MVLIPAVIMLLMACFGILLNVYVLRRLHKFARKEPGRFENGCGLPLLVMTIADILVLLGVVVFGVFGSVIIAELHKHSFLQNVVCKSMVYWTHVTTNVSMWCWVLMSAMRYMAVYHPFLQLRISVLPRRGLQLIILLSLLLNTTFIGAVEVRDNKCEEAEVFGWRTATWFLNLAEIFWGFIAPVLFTLCMDGRVLLADPPVVLVRRHVRFDVMQPLNNMNDLDARSPSTTNLASYRTPLRLRSTVFKWLAITSINLLLNAPDNLLRLAILFADDEQPVWEWYWPARSVSQLCYFGQFGFNACYLSLVVYNRSIKPKRSTTLAISVLNQSPIVSSPANTTGNPSVLLTGSLLQLRPMSGCFVGKNAMVYFTHVTTNVSMWCWVLMSAMRYMAVYHPFLQLRIYILPRRGLQLIILFSLLLNATSIGAVEVRDNECQVGGRKCSSHVQMLIENVCEFAAERAKQPAPSGEIMFVNPHASIWSGCMPARVVAQVCYFGQFGLNAMSFVAYN